MARPDPKSASKPGRKPTPKPSPKLDPKADPECGHTFACKFSREIVRVFYSRSTDRVRIIFDDRTIYVVPRRLIEGLDAASTEQLKRIDIHEAGPSLNWPLLGVTHSVPQLLNGIYGSPRWMASLERMPKQTHPREAMFAPERRKAGARMQRFLDGPVIMTNAALRSMSPETARRKPSRKIAP